MEKREVIKIKLDRSIYSLSAIKKGINDYHGLASFSLEQKKDYFQVTARDVAQELRPLFKQEFCNYVLSLEGILK